MAATNKHKAHGQKKKEVKVSWWTPEKVKAMISICAVIVLVAVGIGIYRYFDNIQDSIVGSWNYSFESQMMEEKVTNTYTFKEDKSCELVQVTESGEEVLHASGTYSIDEKMNAVTIMMNSDQGTNTSGIYNYRCKGGKLILTGILQNGKYEYTKAK